MLPTRWITVLVVVAVVAAGFWLARPGGDDVSGAPEQNPLAGEVALTLPGAQTSVDPDMLPPDFFIIPAGQKAVTLAQLKGKPVLINFWNTWCPSCCEEMPDLDKLYRKYRDSVEFIFINILVDEQSLQDVTSFLDEHRYTIPVYLDRQGDVARAYGLPGIPVTVVLDAGGQVVYAAAGPISYHQAEALLDGCL